MSARLIKIGRGKDNDLIVDDASVSRNHAELFIDEDGRCFLTDLGSSNGTSINGKRLKGSEILSPNDIVKLGNAKPLPWYSFLETSEAVSDAPQPIKTVEPQAIEEEESSSYLWMYISIAVVVAVGIIIGGVFLAKSYNESGSTLAGKTPTETGTNPSGTTAGDTVDQISNAPQPVNNSKTVSYDYSCMNAGLINEGSDWETEIINMSDVAVSLKEERRVGKQLYNACVTEYKFLTGEKLNRIKKIKNKLVNQIRHPRGFNYKIYLVQDNEINAFTAGGYIFVTTGMYNFVRNDDELACVIGHEIAHNERKHINLQLKRQKATTELLGELSDIFGEAADALAFMVSTPFNQKKETESDFYGIDYATRAGYNSCEAIHLWQRMSQQEGEVNQLDKIMRSHPYSIERSSCCKNHIQSNYDFVCD
ncbi:FHA domain-containing protein [Crocinitomicaceae bacterium]|nr:FHA domain-containing protein [Crocinitomicaceae bacterium]